MRYAGCCRRGLRDFAIIIDQQDYTFSDWMDHMQYKLGLVCLADADLGDICLDVEKKTLIPKLIML